MGHGGNSDMLIIISLGMETHLVYCIEWRAVVRLASDTP
jgi:hypothetical protein